RRTALQAAAESGNIELVQVLLHAGAYVNAPAAKCAGATSLQVAALFGHVRVATILLNAGADANAHGALINGRTALEGAAEHGRIDMVQLLLNAGVDLWGNGNVQYERALQLASTNGHTAVKRLVEAHYKSIHTGDHR
ncbi:ankyrin, partial [Decorospora gaudefroyi]